MVMGNIYGHRCNIRCEPPIHCDLLYGRPEYGSMISEVGKRGEMIPFGHVKILAVEPAVEAAPHAKGHPDYNVGELVTFRVLDCVENGGE